MVRILWERRARGLLTPFSAGRALSLGASDGDRTRNILLGRQGLRQLSYTRVHPRLSGVSAVGTSRQSFLLFTLFALYEQIMNGLGRT